MPIAAVPVPPSARAVVSAPDKIILKILFIKTLHIFRIYNIKCKDAVPIKGHKNCGQARGRFTIVLQSIFNPLAVGLRSIYSKSFCDWFYGRFARGRFAIGFAIEFANVYSLLTAFAQAQKSHTAECSQHGSPLICLIITHKKEKSNSSFANQKGSANVRPFCPLPSPIPFCISPCILSMPAHCRFAAAQHVAYRDATHYWHDSPAQFTGAIYRCDLSVQRIADFACASQPCYFGPGIQCCHLLGMTLPLFCGVTHCLQFFY